MPFPPRRSGASVPSVIALFKKPVVVRGHRIPSRRFTGWAAVYFLVLVAVPVTLFTLALDLVGWLITVKLLGASCYGVGCLIG